MSDIQKSNTNANLTEKETPREPMVGDVYMYDRKEMRRLDEKTEHGSFRYSTIKTMSPLTWVSSKRNYADGTEFFDTMNPKDSYYTRIEGSNINEMIELAEAAAKALETGDLSAFGDSSENVDENETGLISTKGKEFLVALADGMEEQKRRTELVKSFMLVSMENKKRELDKIRWGMEAIIDNFKKKITKLMRIVSTIELYLGIHEDIMQLQEGEPADINAKICIRQQILFMDEEVGVFEEGEFGIDRLGEFDADNIETFDHWLVTNENYKLIIPEEKGVVALKPRRYRKEYGNSYVNAAMEDANNMTYFLMRNGDNLYRINSNIQISRRMFPLRGEMQSIMELLNVDETTYKSSRDMDEAEQKAHYYKKTAVFLQGLLDRTQVFAPMPRQLSLFNSDDIETIIQLIYDDEYLLPTGRLSFREWVNQINESIERGSRVIHSGMYYTDGSRASGKDFSDRYLKFYRYDGNIPPLPPRGLYNIDTVTRQRRGEDRKLYDYQELAIKYNPKDKVYSWGQWEAKDRKNNISFIVKSTDSFILNYDQISLDDINFYLYSRTDRHNYVRLLSVLKEMKKHRLAELKWEKDFAKMTASSIALKMRKDQAEVETKVWEAIEWWKMKVIRKRPITNDDAKAFRMIESRVINSYKK